MFKLRIIQNKKVRKKVKGENQKEAVNDYGMPLLATTMESGDVAFRLKPFKKVILINVDDCKNKISVPSIALAWKGMNHIEWETFLAGTFVQQVVEALKSGQKETEIKLLFGCELIAPKTNRFISQEDIFRHLIHSFTIVEDSKDLMKVSLNIR